MKTGIQMATEAFKMLNVPVLKMMAAKPNIWLLKRPKNSQTVDVIVNTLALNNQQVQSGVFNVNIHAPNLKNVVVDGKADDETPDLNTLTDVSNLVVLMLKDVVGFDFRMSVASPGLPMQDADGSWYINIRVNYTSFNENYI